ncbi:pyrimidine reductase family protein [Nocardia neocaledoniensis]|uniref:pyrimidine reductase family protein n=1 Tax=Nocardia neocaledoniensis TaxID=236511 RepID=UPI0034075E20
MTIPRTIDFAEIDDETLNQLYRCPDQWVRANFVSAIDGTTAIEGRTGTLTAPTDQRVMACLRAAADVVLLGAGTARAEGYASIRLDEQQVQQRKSRGQAADLPVAVVSASGQLPVHLVGQAGPTIVLLPQGLLAARALEDAGAQLLTLSQLTPAAILAALRELGLTRILCEGGPTLLGQLIGADLLDELCLTTAPMLVAGPAHPVAVAERAAVRSMTCQQLLISDDGYQFARWIRARE